MVLEVTHYFGGDCCKIKLNLDCNYNIPIYLPPNGIPFGGSPVYLLTKTNTFRLVTLPSL